MDTELLLLLDLKKQMLNAFYQSLEYHWYQEQINMKNFYKQNCGIYLHKLSKLNAIEYKEKNLILEIKTIEEKLKKR